MTFREVEFDIAFHRFADLQHAAVKSLGDVSPVVKRLVQFRVDIGNVKPFEVIVDIEHPVGLNGVVAVTRWVVNERLSVEEAKSILKHRPRKFSRFFERREMHAHPLLEGKFCQVIACAWKPNRLCEFRHVPEGSIEVEGPPVVPALQGFCRAGLQGHPHASMGADVRKACGFLALEQHHRFASDGFVMVDWKHIVGPKLGLVSGKLPSFEG